MSFIVTSSILSAQSKFTSSLKYELITASKIFVAERSGAHRVLLIGGGGGAGFDNGGGGGSGYVAHATVQLVALASYSVTVGTGGASAPRSTPIGESGTASTFASQDGSIVYLTAAGGLSGRSHSSNIGGDGGSGGGGGYQYPGGDGGTGGGNGTESATPRLGGDGQGASFTSSFSLFLAAQISAGAGGLGSRVSPFGPGGGGGGIVIDGDTSVTGGLEDFNYAQPGIGYGAGAAGKSSNSTDPPSGPGADGMVLIEWN